VREPKRPTWVRFLRVTKLFIEHRVGISLGDALNIALFSLTLLSIAIAVIGTWVAIKAMREAKAGGDAQQQTLEASRKALADVVGDLGKLNGTVDLNLKTAKEQQRLLETQLHVASRHPDVYMRVSCGPRFWGLNKPRPKAYDFIVSRTKIVLNGKALHSTAFASMPPHSVRTDVYNLITCYVSLTNTGEANLTNSFVKIRFSSDVVGRFFPNADGKSAGFEFKVWDPRSGQSDLDIPYSEVVEDRPIDVLRDRTVYPQSPNDEYLVADLTLHIPHSITSFLIEYEFGGDQQPTKDFTDIMGVDHTGARETQEHP
jgi:hypothetical protein